MPFIHARYDLSEPDVRFNNSFEIAVPALYAELVRSYYREATGFIVSFRYADGTAADLILDMGPEVTGAFRPMLELWGEPPVTEAAAP